MGSGWIDEIRSVQEAVIDEFSEDEPVVVYPADDRWTPIEIRGVFDDAHSGISMGDAGDVMYSSENPVLGIRDADHPAKRGDEVEVRGRRFRCSDVRPDGQGFSVMVLESV